MFLRARVYRAMTAHRCVSCLMCQRPESCRCRSMGRGCCAVQYTLKYWSYLGGSLLCSLYTRHPSGNKSCRVASCCSWRARERGECGWLVSGRGAAQAACTARARAHLGAATDIGATQKHSLGKVQLAKLRAAREVQRTKSTVGGKVPRADGRIEG